jgi:phage tail sheath gpL-like
MYDLGSTPIYNQIYLGASCGVATAGTVLTGTTGTDGIITLSFAAETLYVENRTGVSAPVFLNFFAGH